MIHYHVSVITPETAAIKVLTGRHALVSWADDRNIEMVAAICQSFVLDNGAFTAWKSGGHTDWDNYYSWAGEWLTHPACDWAVIPDVIEGTEAENDELLADWPHGHRGVPVWHLNESLDRFARLCEEWPRVALGSAAEFDVSTPSACVARVAEAIYHSTGHGRPKAKLHGLRMLNPKIVAKLPLSSADSSNVARNVGMDVAWKGTYAPATREGRGVVIADRLESVQSPSHVVLKPISEQMELTA